MPPGPVYNWLCVAHSVVDILSIATRIRSEQVARTCGATGGTLSLKRKRVRVEDSYEEPYDAPASPSRSSEKGPPQEGLAAETSPTQPSLSSSLPLDTTTHAEPVSKVAESPSSLSYFAQPSIVTPLPRIDHEEQDILPTADVQVQLNEAATIRDTQKVSETIQDSSMVRLYVA